MLSLQINKFFFFFANLFVVIGNALTRNPSPGQVVARVNILASEG